MSQLSYDVDPAIGVVGGIIETGDVRVESYPANGVVRPGQYVTIGAGKVQHPSAAPTAATRGGMAIRRKYAQNDGVYADGDMVDVLVRGRMLVASEVAVTADTVAYVRFSAAGLEEKGALRNDADTADAAAVPGLYFRTAGTTVELDVNRSAA